MSETTRSPHTAEPEGDERFKRFVAFLITSLIIVAAVVSWLQTQAGAKAAQLGREVQSYAIRAMGLKTSGQARVSYGWQGAYQNWEELSDLAKRAEFDDRAAEAARYGAVRDRMAELSPLLSPPYFDAEADSLPDISQYEADVYLVQSTALSEHYTDSAEQNEAWDGKARAHITHLTLLAVTLSLFGLSTTITGRVVRWLFVAAGTVIAAFTLVWILIVAVWPVPRLEEAAIEAYAQGVGLAWQGSGENRVAYEDAIAKFDEALGREPGYANALYERGNTRLALADAAMAAGDDAAVTDYYEQAVADFEAAQAAGRDDTNVGWNLGWTYYLLARYDDAIRMDRHTLQLDPDLVGVRTNLGVALLVAGQMDEAQHEYQNAMDTATRLVTDAQAAGKQPPASLWWYLDAGAIDLVNLLDRLDGRVNPWTQAPPPDTVTDPGAVRTTAGDTIKQLKELLVALEFTGQPPQAEVSAVISPLEFGLERNNADGEPVGYDVGRSFPYETNKVLILFDYEGMSDGQKIIWKVYRDGFEQPDLRLAHDWNLSDSGSAELRIGYSHTDFFIFSSGEYVVEMFVDNRLMQRGGFTIRDTQGAVPLKTSGASGDVLFQDDFSDPFSGWDRIQHEDYTIDYTDGSYWFYVKSPNILVRGQLGLDLADVSVEVDATKLSGPTGEFGIVCRYDGATGNYYLLEVSDTGAYAIFKRKDDGWETLVDFTPTDAVRTGEAANHLRADCAGDTLTLYVNDEKVAEARDTDLTSGDVGLLAGASDQPGVEILFDNFVVRQP